MVRRYLPNATVYFFDLAARTAESLRNNVKDFGAIEVVVEALSDRTGQAEFYDDTFNGRPADALASVERRLPTQIGTIEVARRTQVRLNTVDHFRAQRGIEVIDLLKTDVGGTTCPSDGERRGSCSVGRSA